MNRYAGIKCPHCGKPFTENDMVVVCPECGAPYHRSCFEEMGRTCQFTDKHAEGYNWNAEQEKKKQEEQRRYQDARELRCSRCGTVNNSQNSFCDVCGTPLRRPESEGQAENQQNGPAGAQGTASDESNHAEGPQDESNHAEGPQDEADKVRCGRCGTLNNDQNIFCTVCGTPLHGGNAGQPGPDQQPNAGQQNPYANGPFRTMGYNPYTTPYGGLNPDEEIDGIPVKELAIYVGENSQYYLPKFKEMKTNGRNVINWSGFFLEFIFLVYRKMYLAAAIVFVLSNLLTLGVMLFAVGGDVSSMTQETYNMISMFTYAISIAVRFFVGFSFNRLYMNRCFKRIRKLKEQFGGNETTYYESLTKSGSVSRKAVIIVFAVYMILTMAILYLSVFLTP